jgi:hypothetical protein
MVHVSAGPLRSRTVGFPQSGSDPGLTLRSPSHTARSLRADPHPPLRSMVCFPGRSMVHRPNMSGYSWSCQVPRAPLHEPGVTSLVGVSRTPSAGATLPSSLLRAHASVLHPPRASVVPLDTRFVQVAVSPCWEEDLPDVISAHPSLRAWPPPPAALEVHMPVSSPTTSACPPCGPGRRSTMPMQRLQHGALCEAAGMPSRSGPQVCSPPRSLLPLRRTPHGSRGFYVRASRGL